MATEAPLEFLLPVVMAFKRKLLISSTRPDTMFSSTSGAAKEGDTRLVESNARWMMELNKKLAALGERL